jgi:hypothetical protein
MRLAQGPAFWGFNIKKFYVGSYSQKLSHFSAGIGISSLNVDLNNFKMARPILVICSSNDASSQKEFSYEAKLLKFAFWRVITMKSPTGLPIQNTPCYNFLTTQPIHTNTSKNFDLGQQFSREFPQGEVPSHNQIVLTFQSWNQTQNVNKTL